MRIPGLIDILRTDDPAQIDRFAQDLRLDRRFEPVGPLFNRILARRIRRTLQIDGVPLPAVAPRSAPGRADKQAALTAALSDDRPPCDEAHLEELAAHVLGHRSPEMIGPLVQEVVGRRFRKDYRASRATWDAARLLDVAPRSLNPLRWVFWAATGRVGRAKRLLAEGVEGDAAALHAVGIAIHNLVRSLERMRTLAAQPNVARGLSAETAVAISLAAPDSVLRQATSQGSTRAGSFRRGTLVLLQLEQARTVSERADLVFLSESWSRCPAHAWVPRLLAAAWTRAADHRAQESRRETAMDQAMSLEWTRSVASSRRIFYQRLLGFSLAAIVALGLFALVAPATLSSLMGLPPPSPPGWPRAWGGVLLLVPLLYVPGLLEPVCWRWSNVVGILGRFGLALLYAGLGGGFLWLALIEAAFALSLGWLYFGLFKAELMSRP